MSYKIKGTTIILTRGDTLYVKVNIMKDGEPYAPETGDTVRFALKHKTMTADGGEYTDAEPILTKVIPNDTMVLHYAYDIQITFADGSVDTFITASTFRLTPEVD